MPAPFFVFIVAIAAFIAVAMRARSRANAIREELNEKRKYMHTLEADCKRDLASLNRFWTPEDLRDEFRATMKTMPDLFRESAEFYEIFDENAPNSFKLLLINVRIDLLEMHGSLITDTRANFETRVQSWGEETIQRAECLMPYILQHMRPDPNDKAAAKLLKSIEGLMESIPRVQEIWRHEVKIDGPREELESMARVFAHYEEHINEGLARTDRDLTVN